MERFFKDYFQQKFPSSSSTKVGLEISIIGTVENEATLAFSDGSTSNIDKLIELNIIVGQRSTSILIVALQVSLFLLNGERRLFIKSVDTSGYFEPRNLQSQITKALIDGLLEYLKVNEFNLFASPRPSLLFSASHLSTLKRPLNGELLSKWWLTVLQPHFESIFIYSPNNFTGLTDIAKDMTNSSCKIHFKIPFDSKFPLFDGDVKRTHFNALFNTSISNLITSEFFASMALKEEFSVGFGCIMKGTKRISSLESQTISTIIEDLERFCVSKSTYRQFISKFSKMSFENKQKAVDSSRKITDMLQKNQTFYVEVSLKVNVVQTTVKESSNSTNKRKAIQNVQSLIKRKPAAQTIN